MKNTLYHMCKQLLFTSLVISNCLSMGAVLANSSRIEQQFQFEAELNRNSFSNSGKPQNRRLKATSALKSVRWAQNSQKRFLSKSEVVRAVKKRYNARVLKITLNEPRAVYRVRVLMPSGKIKNININARR